MEDEQLDFDIGVFNTEHSDREQPKGASRPVYVYLILL